MNSIALLDLVTKKTLNHACNMGSEFIQLARWPHGYRNVNDSML